MATDLKIPARPARLLPIGVQDFPKLRENGYIYVDKTPRIDTKAYASPWAGSGKKVFKVGVDFDYGKRVSECRQ